MSKKSPAKKPEEQVPEPVVEESQPGPEAPPEPVTSTAQPDTTATAVIALLSNLSIRNSNPSNSW